MNYNILAYCIYLLFTFTVIVKVGKICYHHGKVYSLQIFDNDAEFTNRVNNILLVCYYLLNLGYCLLTISTWQIVVSWQQCIETVAIKAGTILITIGIIHFINIAAIIYISKHHTFSHH